jgi:hypothetical protein
MFEILSVISHVFEKKEMPLNLPAEEVPISTVNCMGCEQWRFG